jgi:hypothetical protein
MNGRDPLRDIFGGLLAAPSPTPEQTESARRALMAAMQEDVAPRPRRRLAAISGAAVLVLVVVFAALVPWSSTPASALFAELARATRTITPEELPDGSYVYVTSDRLDYGNAAAPVDGEFVEVVLLLPSRVEAWWQGDSVESETTVARPIFFDQESEDFFYSHGLDASYFVGETRRDVLSGIENQADPDSWSTDPKQLADQMRQEVADDPEGVPEEVKMLNLADELLAPQLLASPSLRAAILDVVSTLNIEDRALDDGRISASITYELHAYGTVTTEWIFDANGYLVERRSTTITGSELTGLPPDTVYDSLTQTPPVIVPEPGVRP